MRRRILFFIGLRDIAVLIMLVGIFFAVLFLVLPRIRAVQSRSLEEFYISYQKDLIKQEVISFAQQLVTFKKSLKDYFDDDAHVSPYMHRYLIEQLPLNRFGAEGEGYFFILDDEFNMLYHGDDTELQNTSLYDIKSRDAKNLGEEFEAVFRNQTEGFINYYWQAQSKDEPEYKTTYAVWNSDLGWFIAAGFYHSDLDVLISRVQNSSSRSIQKSLNTIYLLGLPLFLFWLGLSLWVYWRIHKINETLHLKTQTLEQYKILLDETSIVTRTDTDGHITYVNKKFEKVTGYSSSEALESRHNIERHPDTPLEVFKDLWQTIKAGKVWQGVIKNRKANGESYLKQATIVPIRNERGEISEFVSAGQDITVLIDQAKALERAFMTDSLTGLGSRSKFMADLEALAINGVGLLNIQDFKSLNRMYTQSAGDRVLQVLAEWLIDELNSHYLTYRIHADTFAVIAHGPEHDDFIDVMTRLYKSHENFTVDIDGKIAHLSLRMGASQRGEESFLYADLAMEKAREMNQGLHICEENNNCDCTPRNKQFMEIVTELHNALDHDRVCPVFQPIKNLESGRIEKFECLMRIEKEDGSLLMPFDFLDIAKSVRLYESLTLRMIEKAVDFFQGQDYEFAVNLGVEDLTNPQTIEYLLEKVKSSGVGERLVIEIVETQQLENMESANMVLDKLKNHGIKIAIDDFGSGYASFNYLVYLNPDYIKIDGSIIKNIQDDLRAREMVHSIVEFARRSGMKTIAEYVDSHEIYKTVEELGVDFIQGWLIGKAEAKIPV